MLFNSLEFVIFLPLVIILYFITPYRFRWILLLAASYYFYMCWRVEYIILIITSTLIDYMSGIMMSKIKEKRRRIKYLILSLLTNFGLLFSFKYYNFFADTSNLVFGYLNIYHHIPELKVLLPVGISFYTFQTLSYSIEVFQGKQEAEKHLGYFALYVAFFPQLVAGPIERFNRLAPQLKQKHDFSYDNLINGLRLILYGFFIKMVIADNISVYVDQIYNSPETYNTISVITGLIFYSFQIYSDFYGYSLIAIGSALIMGINIIDNFKTPYLAKNISEFWQRWHISLSTWFRDYLYFPLGGNKVKKLRWILNILIVFTVSGLWHGANWTFVFWGAIFGIIYLLEKAFNKTFNIKPVEKKFSFKHILLALKTFSLVTIIWIFFRSQGLTQMKSIFHALFYNSNIPGKLTIDLKIWIFVIGFIISDIILYNNRFDKWCSNKPVILRWTIYGLLIYTIIVYSGVENFPFIYFQF